MRKVVMTIEPDAYHKYKAHQSILNAIAGQLAIMNAETFSDDVAVVDQRIFSIVGHCSGRLEIHRKDHSTFIIGHTKIRDNELEFVPYGYITKVHIL